MKKLTPAQQQYMDMKKQHPDCVLFFRLGDFYEVFYEDAHIAHKVLGITLTARDKQAPDPIPMAGIPHHTLERYLPPLILAGYKVAIADQVGEVIPGRLVERKITQIVTPGTWVEEGSLVAYIVAVTQYKDHRACAWGDVTLGVWTTRLCHTRDELLQAILLISPREIICDGFVRDVAFIERRARDHLQSIVSSIPIIQDEEQWLIHTLGVSSLEGYGPALHEGVRHACASLFFYLQTISQPLCIRRIESWQDNGYMSLDSLTVKNLEIFQGSYQGNKKQSLFGVINTCSTSMGSRLLAYLLAHPSQDIMLINDAQKAIRHWFKEPSHAQEIHKVLSVISDFPRLMQQINQGKRMIYGIRQLAEQIQYLHSNKHLYTTLELLDSDVFEKLHTFAHDVVVYIKQGTIDENDWVMPGINSEVDRLRHIDVSVDEKLISYQQAWFIRSGVSVKVKYIINQGYFLEITPKDIKRFESCLDSMDQSWGAIRAQTLKTGQRYITPYLQELQGEISTAKENLSRYHRELAQELFSRWQEITSSLYKYADFIAKIDLYSSLSLFMHEKDWCLPTMLIEGDLEIIGGRHPVVEAYLGKEEQFIPNDTLCTKDNFFHVITGPNMGGKSTYMRQQALIVLLAHSGLPVPAVHAKIPLMDGIYARIGSGDLLAKQQSTFMTEMIETAAILHNATERSFLVIDELGRGTSTSDGLALAKAIIVYICQEIKAKTLFATHYHELIALESSISGIQNRHVGVYETDHEVVFLKKICRGGADKSYGIDVAKLAGIPSSVLKNALIYLQEDLEVNIGSEHLMQQTSLFSFPKCGDNTVFDELCTTYGLIDVHAITPIDAMRILQEIVLKLRK